MIISRQIDIDYGHTLPNHYSFCNQIHGHRAKIVVYFQGWVNSVHSSSSEAMVLDFSVCKKVMVQCIHDVLDHGFAVWKKDTNVINFAKTGENLKLVSTLDFIKGRNTKVLVTEYPPTAEYLATWGFDVVDRQLTKLNIRGINVVKVLWYETPNNCAEATDGNMDKFREKS